MKPSRIRKSQIPSNKILLSEYFYILFKITVKFSSYSADIIDRNIQNSNIKDTVEICSQGGIIAANGFLDFKVYPVQVISGVPKVKRENNRSRQRKASISSPFTFADVLDRVTADHQPDEQPNDCYIVTYNANRQLQTYLYRPTVEYIL